MTKLSDADRARISRAIAALIEAAEATFDRGTQRLIYGAVEELEAVIKEDTNTVGVLG